jgi:hypothetical protein
MENIPLHTKIDMLEDIVNIIHFLHTGERSSVDLHINNLKANALYGSETLQQHVLNFSEQVQFQYDYDPDHRINKEIQDAADTLIQDLGFPKAVDE